MGNQAEQEGALRGLKHAAGFFQSKVADRLQTRYTPLLTFKLDDSVKKSVEMSRLIAEAVASDRKPAAAEDAPEGPAEDAGEADENPHDRPHNEAPPASS